MAHVSTEEYWEIEADGDATPATGRHWTRQFKVIFNSIEYANAVLNAPGLPVKWDSHPADSTMLAKHSHAGNLQGDPFCWLVTVDYDSNTGPEDRGEENPLDRPTEIETDFASFQKPLLYDKDGVAVLNSAGDPFDPYPQIEDSRFIVRCARFEADFTPARSLAYRNAVNTDALTIGDATFEPGEGMCMFIKQRFHYENTHECWFTMYEFQFKNNGQVMSGGALMDYQGWDVVVPDVGFNELLDGPSGFRILITDGDGKAVSVPVRLDGAGRVLLPHDAPPEDTQFRIFKPDYRYLPFAPLGLP